MAGLADRVAADVHTLGPLDAVCSSSLDGPSGVLHPLVTSLLLEHGSLWWCYTEPPSSCRSEGGPRSICFQISWGLPVCRTWAWLSPCSGSGAHIRDVNVRRNLVDHAEHIKSSMGLSSMPSKNHPAEMSFSPGPQHLCPERQKALAKPSPAVSTQCSA